MWEELRGFSSRSESDASAWFRNGGHPAERSLGFCNLWRHVRLPLYLQGPPKPDLGVVEVKLLGYGDNALNHGIWAREIGSETDLSRIVRVLSPRGRAPAR